MSLKTSVLAANLEDLAPTSSAATAAQTLADAYGDYMSKATATGTILSVTGPTAAMAAAMTFSDDATPAEAAAIFQAGCVAFWGYMAANPLTCWALATLITPPAALTGLGAALTPIFPANRSLSLAASAAAMAAAIDTATTGGTVTYSATPPPVTIA